MQDDRKAQRRPARQHGIVILSNGTTVDCTIHDVSDAGARLSFAHPNLLPKRFRLRSEVTPGDSEVTLVWHRGCIAGVSFARSLVTGAMPRKKKAGWF